MIAAAEDFQPIQRPERALVDTIRAGLSALNQRHGRAPAPEETAVDTDTDIDEVALCAGIMAIAAAERWSYSQETPQPPQFDGGYLGYIENCTRHAATVVRVVDGALGSEPECCVPYEVYRPLARDIAYLLLERGEDCSVPTEEVERMARELARMVKQ